MRDCRRWWFEEAGGFPASSPNALTTPGAPPLLIIPRVPTNAAPENSGQCGGINNSSPISSRTKLHPDSSILRMLTTPRTASLTGRRSAQGCSSYSKTPRSPPGLGLRSRACGTALTPRPRTTSSLPNSGHFRRVNISAPISSGTKRAPLLVTFGLERLPCPPKSLRRHRPGPVHHDRRTTIPGCRTARSRPKTLPLPGGRGSTLRSSLLRRTGWGEGGRSSHTQPKTRVNLCVNVNERVQFNSLNPTQQIRERNPG